MDRGFGGKLGGPGSTHASGTGHRRATGTDEGDEEKPWWHTQEGEWAEECRRRCGQRRRTKRARSREHGPNTRCSLGAETQSSPSGASRTSGSSRRDPSPIGQASQPRLRPHWPVFWAGVKALARRPRHHHPQPSASLAPLLWACCRDARAPAAAPPYLRTRSPQRRIPNRRRGDTIVVSRVASGAVTASRSSGFRGGTKVDPYCALHDRLRVAVTSQPCFALIWV
jgi:hypothetical protein